MKKNLFLILKLVLTSIFVLTFFTSCAKDSYDKVITGSNNFYSLVDELVGQMHPRMLKYISEDDVVLVSDFVNLDKLKNRSKLGFVLSDSLKTSLSNKNIIVREIKLRENFTFGQQGLNVLTREYSEISKKDLNTKYALVGTYSITTESLILFVKLIEIETGNILGSKSNQTSIDNEIIELEREHKKQPRVINAYAPLVL